MEASAKSLDRALNEAIRRSLNDEKSRPALCSDVISPKSGLRAFLLEDIRNSLKSNSTSPSVPSEAIIDFESEVRQSNRAQGGTNKRELTI